VPAGVEAVPIDFEKPETLPPALAGVEAVFLVSNALSAERDVVRAATRAGVRRIVKLSIAGAGEEAFSLARWHRAVEREIEASAMGWTHLRPTGFMQNVVNFMGPTIRSRGLLVSSVGDARIALIDARDIGEVAAEVLAEGGHEGRAYELSGPSALTFHDVAKSLSAVLGREIRYVPISDDDYKKGAMGAGIPEIVADALVDLNRYLRERREAPVSPAVRELLGRDPIPFDRFARDHTDALR
jgi:uncharacterized protein YbjT (DUF2867 family)